MAEAVPDTNYGGEIRVGRGDSKQIYGGKRGTAVATPDTDSV